MKRASQFSAKVIEEILLLLMCVLVSVTFLQVLARFVFKIPISWSQELVKLCFVWSIFLGSAIAVKEGTHLTLDMLTASLPVRIKRGIRISILLLMMICSVILAYGGGRYCMNAASKSMITLPLPANVQYISMPISAVLMLFYLAEKLKEEMTKTGGDKS